MSDPKNQEEIHPRARAREDSGCAAVTAPHPEAGSSTAPVGRERDEAKRTAAVAVPDEAAPSAPATSTTRLVAARRPGTFGAAAEAWAEGVRSVTGARPQLKPWDRSRLEDLARDGPWDDPEDGMRRDGALYAKRQTSRGQLISVDWYTEWVTSGRPLPPRDAERARRDDAERAFMAKAKRTAEEAVLPPADLLQRAGLG